MKSQLMMIATIGSPLGGLFVVTDADGRLAACEFSDFEERLHRLLARRFGKVELAQGAAPRGIADRFDRYFSGALEALDGIEIVMSSTQFQQTVWTALRQIKPGQTMTYAALAERLDRPKAARAVGHANAANPFEIVVPCHRLVGAGGALTGYAGGLERKDWLLRHEAQHAGSQIVRV